MPAFTIIPAENPPGWFTVLEDGKPVWHGPQAVCERYVSDPKFRESLKVTKLHDREPT